MKKALRTPTLAALLLLVSLCGCGTSAPVHFYALSGAGDAQKAALSESPCFSLGVGPVEIPAYLDRSDIVTRSGDNRMRLAEFDQWGELLGDGLTRVLMENLDELLCAAPLVPVPLPEGIRTDYQVAVQVRRFDGALGKQAVLRADWSVLDSEGRLLAWKQSRLQESVSGGGYQALAATLSTLVMDLSREIAAELQQLARKKNVESVAETE